MSELNDTIQYLRGLAERGYFGSIELKFQRGQVTHLRQDETLKLNELPGLTRRTNDTNDRTA